MVTIVAYGIGGPDLQGESMEMHTEMITDLGKRRRFIGGSDARIIMGDDEATLLRLWQEKRGEIEPEDLSRNLIIQLGLVTEDLNRRWYEANTGEVITDVQRLVRHPTVRWMGATLDGRVDVTAPYSKRNSCFRRRSRRTRPRKNTCRNCSITCGSSRRGLRCSQ